MGCRLLVKNISNVYSTGDVITVESAGHVFGKYESKEAFVASGFNKSDWPRQFIIVNVTDANREDLLFLLDDTEEGRRYFLTPQGADSPYYKQLLEDAEITTVKSVLLSFINDRGE